MERTPKSKNKFPFSNKLNDSGKYECSILEESTSTDSNHTPVQNRLSSHYQGDYSPLYIQQTQETLDHLDVVWDWNSPQSKHKQTLPVQKRPHSYHSPKPVKRHPSNTEIESYDKLKNELEALKHQLVESRCNEKSSSKALFQDVEDDKVDDLKDLENFFDDDSLEEEMILQSQKVEQLLTMEIKSNPCDITDVQNVKTSDISAFLKSEVKTVNTIGHIKNSSINCEKNQKTNCLSKTDVSKANASECKKPIENKMFDDIIWGSFANDNLTDTFQNDTDFFHEDNDVCNVKTHEVKTIKICSTEEIERKRLEALAKLKWKKQLSGSNSSFSGEPKQTFSNNPVIYKDEVSPIKCSPEEIEQKRLQALAKLQEKRKQEQIEKNRKEALKRLEISKKKRALQNLSNKK